MPLKINTDSYKPPSKDLKRGGTLLTAASLVNTIYGNYYQVKNQQSMLQQQAQNKFYSSDMAQMNAKQTRQQAESVLEAARKQMGLKDIRAGQLRGSNKASLGARGIRMGMGSAAEVIASNDLVNEIDSLTINANAVRQAEALKQRAVDMENQSRLENLSARNLLRTSESLSGKRAVFNTLLSNAGTIAKLGK